MDWTGRVKEAAYTSPGGTRTVFQFADVRTSVEKRTSAFDFPDVDGTYVQDLGRSGRRFPFRLFFSGPDYDTESDAFLETLLEKGPGKLEHPIYGTFDAIPLGVIDRRDDLVTAANQAVYELTFCETTGVAYPDAQTDPEASVRTSVAEYNVAAAEAFEDSTSLTAAVSRATLKSQIGALLSPVDTVLGPVAALEAKVRRKFENVRDSINAGIDQLISQPLTLAFQVTQLIQAPALAAAGIGARLQAYGDLARSIISGDGAVVTPGLDSRNSNQFHARDLFASTYSTGMVASVVETTFTTKPEAIAAATEILDLFDEIVVWRDANFESLAEIDPGEAYQKLQEAVAIAAGFLVEISFSLKQERRITLDRRRTVIDLVAELYGEIEGQLDFFIQSNNLSGSEILELQEGREIVYFV